MKKNKFIVIIILSVILYGISNYPSEEINTIKGINLSTLQHSFSAQSINIFDENLNPFTIIIGDREEKVVETLGIPNRKDASKYGFLWYIYNDDYTKYIQVGIKEGEVVALYTNANAWQFENTAIIGVAQEEIRNYFGTPLEYIKKGNTLYYLNNTEHTDTYFLGTNYITIFYDIYENNQVTAIKQIERNTEERLLGFYGEESELLREGFERQIFDLTNAIRVRYGKPPLEWDDQAMVAARKHSMDMAQHNFFNHENLEGKGPSQRIDAEGISWRKTAENIAAGQTSAIYAHEAWMNSEGHRVNILGDFTRLGVGASFGGEYQVYYTQKFYTPR